MKKPKLFGPAGKLAAQLETSLAAKSVVKLLFYGKPGTGKTSLANVIAEGLCGGSWGVESENGRNVTIHVVRRWQAEMNSSSLFGTGWKAIIVNEVDTMPSDAQDALLTLLDEMPANRAFIATSNMNLANLSERFSTRFPRYEVEGPSTEDILAHVKGMGVPDAIAVNIAFCVDGNVRSAELDAEQWLDGNPGKAVRAPKNQPAEMIFG